MMFLKNNLTKLFYCGRKIENQKKILKKNLFETHSLTQ
jgi:hypothetical protein